MENKMKIIDIQHLNLQSVDEKGKIQTSFSIEKGTGFVIIKNAILASEGVLPYLGARLGLTGPDADKYFNVFQPGTNLFSKENLEGANHVVVTDEHPDDRVVEIYKNGNFIQFGFSLGAAKKIGKYLVNDIKLTDGMAIDIILSGESLGFSLGYVVEYKSEAGVYKDNGVDNPYEYVKTMKNINHIAFTRFPRNKETIFTDEKDKKQMKRKFTFNLGKGIFENITTDSLEEVSELVIKQSAVLAEAQKALKDLTKVGNDSSEKVAELEAQIAKLQEELKAEKEKLDASESKNEDEAKKAENDSLVKDVKEFAEVQNITISNDSVDASEVMKAVLTDSGVENLDKLDMNALKSAYAVMKKANSGSTMSVYKTGGGANDSEDKKVEELQSNFFGGQNLK
jgi:hypothetical protein